MSLIEQLKASGFEPEASKEGEFTLPKGIYQCTVTALRPEKQDDGSKYYQFEAKPQDVIEGDKVGDNFTFKKRFYVDGEFAQENLKKLVNMLFTAGIDLDMSGDDDAFEASFEKAIGKVIYIRSASFKKKDTGEEIDFFKAMKEDTAEKKRAKASAPEGF